MKNAKIYRRAVKTEYKRMAQHSRVVFLLKIALPSIIALFLGAILIVPSVIDEVKQFRFDMPSIDTSSDVSYYMDRGSFYGQADDGSIFSVNVQNFSEQKEKDAMLFSKINARIFLKNGKWIELITDKGNYKKVSNLFFMDGNVVVNDSDDNRMFTDEAIVNINDMSVLGRKPVMAVTSFGVINSDGFDFKRNDKYVFTGKVRGSIDTSKLKQSSK